MSDLYARAAGEIPQMQKEARDRKRGQLSFDLTDTVPGAATYEYSSPWPPPGADGETQDEPEDG